MSGASSVDSQPSAGRRRRVCVFCGSNRGTDPRYSRAARDLGAELAAQGHDLVFGGGRVGLMGVVADAALAGGAEVTGVMPRHLVEREIAHRGLTSLVVTESMHERKATMAALADGFVVLPGGFGTVEEAVEVLTWNQLGLLARPVVLFDVAGYFESLLAFFDAGVRAGFVRREHRGLVQRATAADEAVRRATTDVPLTPEKWFDESSA